jgi:hypothetical protein
MGKRKERDPSPSAGRCDGEDDGETPDVLLALLPACERWGDKGQRSVEPWELLIVGSWMLGSDLINCGLN